LNLGEADLERRRRGEAERLQLARRPRRERTLSLNWIVKRLSMGAAGELANLLRPAEMK
jgi:hypothetical protein